MLAKWQNSFLDPIASPPDWPEWEAAARSVLPDPPTVMRLMRQSSGRWRLAEASRAQPTSQEERLIDLREPVLQALRAAHKSVD